jgi:hypothetical protein
MQLGYRLALPIIIRLFCTSKFAILAAKDHPGDDHFPLALRPCYVPEERVEQPTRAPFENRMFAWRLLLMQLHLLPLLLDFSSVTWTRP